MKPAQRHQKLQVVWHSCQRPRTPSMAERASAVLVVGRPKPVTSVLRPVARTATKELVQVVYKATNDQATVPHVCHCSPLRDTLLVVTSPCGASHHRGGSAAW